MSSKEWPYYTQKQKDKMTQRKSNKPNKTSKPNQTKLNQTKPNHIKPNQIQGIVELISIKWDKGHNSNKSGARRTKD